MTVSAVAIARGGSTLSAFDRIGCAVVECHGLGVALAALPALATLALPGRIAAHGGLRKLRSEQASGQANAGS